MQHPPALRLPTGHHQALALARLASHAAEGPSAADARRAWGVVVNAFRTELVLQFAAEENDLLPALEAAGELEAAARTRREHDEICRLMVEPAGVDPRPLLARFAAVLGLHLGFEERELFPRIEKLSEGVFARIACAEQERASGAGFDSG